MKDFRLDRKADPKYILNVSVAENKQVPEGEKTTETLSITFADGRVFKNIEYVDENLHTIIAQQEKQAKAGVDNLNVFEKRKTKAGVMTGAAIVGGPVIGAVAASLLPNPVTAAIGAGIITIATLIPSAYSLVRNTGKVKELRKIKYRDEHRAELQKYPNYENALVGLSSRKRNWLDAMAEDGMDPFSIAEVDSYSQKDLAQIIENIETEKTYKFTYATRPAASRK